MTFPIVAIAASAGGLEALIDMLSELSPGTGMAFIVAQHLDPSHESSLAEILAKKTSLPVTQIRAPQAVEPNHLYLIAPNTTIRVVVNDLLVTPRDSGIHHPGDILLTSVAQSRAELAIGVVLSGGDGDGALGIQAIKQAGGITFAQQPSSAQCASMPEAAIATACVDFVKRPQDIARELVRLAQQPYLHAAAALTGDPEVAEEPRGTAGSESSLRRIFRLLRTAHGVDFTHYKRTTLGRRLERRMTFHKSADIEDYAALLQSEPAELAALYQDFLIRVTGFFRDPSSFQILARRVFPSIFHDRPPNAPIRIWVPGCATGEEVYSIAIALKEFGGDDDSAHDFQIFGTDVSDASLDKARAGVYLENIAQEVSEERLARFFVRDGAHYRIAKGIRDRCVFAKHDVIRDPPFSRLDLVSCRNLLIYLDATAQRRVMESFHYAVRQRGFLILGPSETVGAASNFFEVADQQHRLYTASASAASNDVRRTGTALQFRRSEPVEADSDSPAIESELAQREADRVLLTRFAPASVLVDDALNILQFRGETSPYLAHASGASSLNLQRVVRPQLLLAIRPGVQKARDSGSVVYCAPIRFDDAELDIEIIPLRRASAERSYLILFEGSSRSAADRRAQAVAPLPESEKDQRIGQLEQENVSLRDYLQATTEEHEANQEELKSAHEEVLSANEEFQSTNEELETAKEELQSTNEELTTTNEELRQRNRELGIVNTSLQEARDLAERAQASAEIIVESVREPLLVLDDKLHVVRVNRAYCLDFGTRSEDIEGRLLFHVNGGRWNVAALRDGLLDVIARGETLEEFEVQMVVSGVEPRSLSLNARRMRGDSHRAAMILLAIADVTVRNARNNEAALEVKRKDEFLAMLAHELRNPLAPIATALQVLRSGPAEGSTTGLHDMIDRQTQRLTRLVDELLDVGRFSRGLMEVKRAPVDLTTLVEQTAAAAAPQIAQRGHELRVVVPPEPVAVNGDAVRLEQVIANLLENASKYTKPGGQITLSLQQNRGEALLSVADTGIGLAADSLDRIFGLFDQVRPAADGGEGLGIGLTLVRRVLELHGGRIEAFSEGLGRGSEFLVHLPKISPALLSSGTGNDVTARGAAAPPKVRRVLIVDDNQDARESLALLIQSWGHEVAEAADGPKAIQLADEFSPDTALLDIGMQGMNGYQLARHFRATPRFARLQLVAMTGFGRDEDRQVALAAGFDLHLVKPISFQALEVTLSLPR